MSLGIGEVIAIVGLIITIVIFVITQLKSNKNKSTEIIHDMFKTEQDYWQKLTAIKKEKKKVLPSEKNPIFNYYEYLAYIILGKKIDEKEAFDLWQPNIIGIYQEFGKEFSEKTTKRTELKKLYKRWKEIKEIKKILLFNIKIKIKKRK